MKTVAIVNPFSGRGEAARKWPLLLKSLGRGAARVETWLTSAPGHAEVLAARARRLGCDRVVAVGGDGTLSEVVNGLWWEPRGSLPSIGMVTFGTGCDYLRNFAVGRSLGDQLQTALGEVETPVAVALCQAKGAARHSPSRPKLVMNVLGFGYSGKVVERLHRSGKAKPGRLAYLVSSLQELIRLESHRLQGEIDGEPFSGEAVLFAAGLGRYFGGGMMITPGASPQSGSLQLLWGKTRSRLEALGLLCRVYGGRHLDHPRVWVRHARRLNLSADPPAPVEADGELLGQTPITVEVIPQALKFTGTDQLSPATPSAGQPT